MSDKKPLKGAGTTFWRLIDSADEPTTVSGFKGDDSWERLGEIKEMTPGEITVEAEDDEYLDDENADWEKSSPGKKSAGETQITLAWKPGENVQQRLISDLDDDVVTLYRAKYPNGTVDVWKAYINSLGKSVQKNEKMTRTIKLKNVGKPTLAEEMIEDSSTGTTTP